MHPTGSSDTILYLPSEIQRMKANTKLIAFIFHLTGLPQLTHEAGVQSWDKCLSILFIHIFLRHNSRGRHKAVSSVVTQRHFLKSGCVADKWSMWPDLYATLSTREWGFITCKKKKAEWPSHWPTRVIFSVTCHVQYFLGWKTGPSLPSPCTAFSQTFSVRLWPHQF